MVYVCILVPFLTSKALSEYLCVVAMLTLPLLWKGWELPSVWNPSIMSDKFSSGLVVLTLWTSIMMMILKPTGNLISFNILLLLLSLLGFFFVSEVLTFFVLFEFSLVPTLFLIMGWGYQSERVQASFYFVFYTITFSIPLLASLIWLSSISGSKYFYFDNLYDMCNSGLGFLILLVFLIKLPLFIVHSWLPKAHVEAPVVGSMILAGVLLKTGGYGLMRVFMYMQKGLMTLSISTLSLLGMVCVCLVCLSCTDLKQIIAFSSVSHMNFMVVGLMSNSVTTYSGGVIMMVAHGLCSSMMFMLADISYKRCGSRSILLNKGFLLTTPFLPLAWGLTVLFNMGFPPSAGSLSELLIITASCETFTHIMMFGLYLFLSAFYSVYLYVTVNHGKSNDNVSVVMSLKESLASVSHLLPLSGITLGNEMLLF